MKNSAGIFARLHPAKFLANSLRNLNQQKKVPLKGVGHKVQDNDLTSRGRGNRLSQVGSRSHQTSQRYPQAGCGRGRDNPNQGKNSWPFSREGVTPTGFKEQVRSP